MNNLLKIKQAASLVFSLVLKTIYILNSTQ